MKPDCLTFDKVLGAKIERVGRADVDAMIKRHYIGRWPGVCVLILAMKIGEELLGVIVFALPPRETMKRYGGETWELARLWLYDAVPQNAETWLIAQAVRYIKKNHPTVKALVSYADPSAGHAGTIYKAANWIADGRTDQDRKSPRFDYADAATGKRYSRRGHVPEGVTIKRMPRVSKFRFIYRMVPPSQRPAGHNGVSTQFEALVLAALQAQGRLRLLVRSEQVAEAAQGAEVTEPNLWPDRAEWLKAFAESVRRSASVVDAVAGPAIAPLKPARTRSVPKKSTTPNPQGETPVSQTETECNTVAQLELDPVEARVERLRNLNEHMITRYLELAVALHEEHESELWAKAIPTGGGRYLDEEEFWQDAVGIKRRTAYQLIAVGNVLAQVSETAGELTTPAVQAEASKELSGVGMYKLDVLVPVLKRTPTLPVVKRWAGLAKMHSREALREMVAKALGRKLRDPADPGEKFRTYIIGKMPDQEARELAIAFFEAGERYTKSNPIGVLICAMQEVLVEWSQAKEASEDAA